MVIGVLILAAARTSAQATSGNITGNVTDSSGATVPNATITITDMDRGTKFTTTSNQGGLFIKTQIPNGRYHIHIEAPGFAPFDQYGPADFDRTHAFTLGHVVDLPFAPNEQFFSNMNTWEALFFGGWQFTGITTAYSGRPFTPVLSSNTSLNSTFGLRPDVTRARMFLLGWHSIQRCTLRQRRSWKETRAGTCCADRRLLGADWELGRYSAINGRVNLHFAWQKFNVFNHPNLSLPNNVVDTPGAGQYSSLESFALPRTMQFSLKLSF